MTDSLRLKSLLTLKGLSQGDLAKHLGLSMPTVSMKINNKRAFKLHEILKICKFLNINNFQECFAIFFGNDVDLRLHE